MTRDQIEVKVKEVIDDLFCTSNKSKLDVNLDDNFVDTYGADSLDIVELIMETEDKFDIFIQDAEVEGKLNIMEDLVNLVEEKVK